MSRVAGPALPARTHAVEAIQTSTSTAPDRVPDVETPRIHASSCSTILRWPAFNVGSPAKRAPSYRFSSRVAKCFAMPRTCKASFNCFCGFDDRGLTSEG